MGFFTKMFKGEPMYSDQDDNSGWSNDKPKDNNHWGDLTPKTDDGWGENATPSSAQTASTGTKVHPRAVITRSNYRVHGTNMDVYVTIQNKSVSTIWLDKIRLLSTVRELDDDLLVNQEHQYLVYSGPRPTHTHIDKAELQYRDETGDYFNAYHFVEFKIQPDNTYIINEFRFEHIKDI
jgi:hypothetical protein